MLACVLQALALAVLLIVIAAAWLFPPARLTPLVNRGLSRALDAPVRLERARLTLFPVPAIALDELVIGDGRGYVRPAAWPRGGLASAAHARAVIELAPLWSRRLVVRELVLTDARVTAIVNERGEANWSTLVRE